MIKTTATILLAFVSLAMLLPPAVYGQEMFESEENGYRLQIPEGWVIQENEDVESSIDEVGFAIVAMLCKEDEALPAIGQGGEHNCASAELTDTILINMWPDLSSRPEFQNASIITTDDLVALHIQDIHHASSQIRIQNTTDVDEFTKLVNMTYTYNDDAGTLLLSGDFPVDSKSMAMVMLSQDRDTGYSINNNLINDNQTQHSPAVQEVFDSFELVS
jgi:hypothetical protein